MMDIDLNPLRVFEILCEECNVTRAAARFSGAPLGFETQPLLRSCKMPCVRADSRTGRQPCAPVHPDSLLFDRCGKTNGAINSYRKIARNTS
jgi:hypothetical protein